MKILSIESSCDETSVAVVEKTSYGITVLSNITATSLEMHAATGGIIPENAARMQAKYSMPVIIEALVQAGHPEFISGSHEIPDQVRDDNVLNWDTAREILKTDIDAIAVTYGPGLIGSLLVGVETAKTLSYIFNKPLLPVNHLLAHIYANFISPLVSLRGVSNDEAPLSGAALHSVARNDIQFPFIGLIVSGGHTDLLCFEHSEKYIWLGGTRDDAAGEALDKIGRLLGLTYPAGPEIERRANLISNPSIKFKSPIMHEDNFDFSFSGLKTEVLRFVQQNHVILEGVKRPIGSNSRDSLASLQNDKEHTINQICFATQKAIIDVLVKKTLKASEKYNCSTILVGGGVSANGTLINELKLNAKRFTLNPQIFSPEKIYCTDNGAMIGVYALMNFKTFNWKGVNANPELYFA